MSRPCECPASGAYYCEMCATLAARAGLALPTQQSPRLALRPRLPLDPDAPERVLQAQIRRLAKERGFLTYHTFDARRSEYGYPDLTLAKPGRLIFAELKSRDGKLTQEQHVWLDMLSHALPGVETYCWRPSDFDNIVHILQK